MTVVLYVRLTVDVPDTEIDGEVRIGERQGHRTFGVNDKGSSLVLAVETTGGIQIDRSARRR